MNERKNVETKRRKYDTTFKEEVLKVVLNGLLLKLSQSLGIGENLIYQWKKSNRKSAAVAPISILGAASVDGNQALYKFLWELGTGPLKALTIFNL